MIKVSRGGPDRIQKYFFVCAKEAERNTSIMLRSGRLENMTGRLSLLGIALLLVAGSANAQIEKEIAAIRADVNLIDKNAAKYEKKTKNFDGLSLEGSQATYFTSGRGLKKIVAKMYGETYRSTAELYYSGEELIFIFQRLERYDTQVGMDPPPKVARIEETRLYRSGGKTIRILSGKTRLKPGDIKFTEAEYQLYELSDELKGRLDRG